MSQAGLTNTKNIPPPPGSITDIEGDDSVVVAPNGSGIIFTKGDPLAPGIVTRGDAGTNTEFFGLMQPIICGTGTTTNTSTADLVTLPLGASAATYTLLANVAGKAATQSGIGGSLFGVVRTDGSTATVISVNVANVEADLILAGASFAFVVSGGSVILRATGTLGTVINWNGCISYVNVTGGV